MPLRSCTFLFGFLPFLTRCIVFFQFIEKAFAEFISPASEGQFSVLRSTHDGSVSFFQNAICGIIILLQCVSLPFPSFAPSHITFPTLLQIHDLCFHDNSVLLKSMLLLRRAKSSIHIYQCFRQRLRRKVVFPFSTGLLK